MTSPVSRRRFLTAAGTTAATVWIPGNVRGYGKAEVLARVGDTRAGAGVSKWELDTPALCVDLDKLDLIVPHCDPVVNEYDVMYGTRQDRVAVVWPISARGRSQ